MKKAIKRGEVFLNGKAGKTGDFVKEGDTIELKERQENLRPVAELAIPVIYEDAHFAALHKPAGLATSGHYFRTLQNTLLFNLQASELTDALKKPRTVHRLDTPTSGLVIAAKTAGALIALSRMFEEKQIKKTYHAVVIGKTAQQGEISLPLEGKNAFTGFNTIEQVPSLRNKFLSLLEVAPRTGRTHQIRRHLSSIGHPIFGDKIYGTEGEIYLGKGLFLAASGLHFTHPFTGKEVRITIPIPGKFHSLLRREKRRFEEYGKSDFEL